MSGYREFGFGSYEEYLRSRHWAGMKRLFMASNQPKTCQGLFPSGRCGSRAIQLHHWTYKRLGREKLTDLVPLCDECHGRVHELCGNTFDSGRLRSATHVVCGLGPWSTKKQRKKAIAPELQGVRRIKPLAAELVIEGAARADLYALTRPDNSGEAPGREPKALDKWSQESLRHRRPGKQKKRRGRAA